MSWTLVVRVTPVLKSPSFPFAQGMQILCVVLSLAFLFGNYVGVYFLKTSCILRAIRRLWRKAENH